MRRTSIPKKADVRAYRQLWRIVDGAVTDAFTSHPDYLSSRQLATVARRSVVKRVVGAIDGYVEQSTRGRSGAEPAAETETDNSGSALRRCQVTGTEAEVAKAQLAGWNDGSSRLSLPDWPAWTELMRDQPI